MSGWNALCCNDGINAVNTAAQGLGHDLYWPPTLPRNYSMEDVVKGSLNFCSSFAQEGLYGLPAVPDEWGRWNTANYGGKRISSHSNIFFSNGNLDPWTAAGVPAPGPTESLPVALISLGGHHLDLFFSTPDDPPSVKDVRSREVDFIQKWVLEGQERLGATPAQPQMVMV